MCVLCIMYLYIVSVYCKCLLRVPIVSVLFWVSLCKTIVFKSVLLGASLCKTIQTSNGVFGVGSPKPYIYRCKCLPYQKPYTCFDLYGKPKWNENRHCDPGGAGLLRCFTLCVCFCVPPSLNLYENPYRSATFVRELGKFGKEIRKSYRI